MARMERMGYQVFQELLELLGRQDRREPKGLYSWRMLTLVRTGRQELLALKARPVAVEVALKEPRLSISQPERPIRQWS
jgi:hypothetical protein